MSGILKNTLRFVGTAKYITTNPTKYIRSMILLNRTVNSSLLCKTNYLHHHVSENLYKTQAYKISANFWQTIQSIKEKLRSIFADEEIKTINFDRFEVSLESAKVGVITREVKKKFIFLPTFNIKLNGKSIKPQSNKYDDEETLSFKLDKWYGSVDSEKLILKLKDSNKTFLLKHTVHVEIQHNPVPEYSKEHGLLLRVPELDFGIKFFDTKITSSTKDLGPLSQTYKPVQSPIRAKELLYYGNGPLDSHIKINNDEVTDTPNNFGQMKLQFPMTVSVEGSRHEIKIKNTADDTFTVYHTVDIEAYNESAETLKNSIADIKKVGKLLLELSSGNLIIKDKYRDDHWIITRQEVDIEIDLDNSVPNILVCPQIKGCKSKTD